MGVRIKSWTALYDQAEAFTIFDQVKRSQRYLDALLNVPADIGIHLADELFDCHGLPVPGIEEFGFQPAEEASHAALSCEQPFRDIERTSFASLIRVSQPGQR